MITDKYIIAEIGVNYYDIAKDRNLDPMSAAKLMITKAKSSGASAAKFQSYKADKLVIKDSPSYWDTEKEKTTSQYDLFKQFDHFSEEHYIELASHCRAIGIDFLSTPFDFEAIDFLEPLMPVYKIASADLTNFPLIQRIAEKRKPIFLSTGASTIDEIRKTLDYIFSIDKKLHICLLHCVLSYPTNYSDANLNRIHVLKQSFPECSIGYSDHTPPDKSMTVPTIAYAFGANVIEKHFTLNKLLPGNDHYHAMDPDDLTLLSDNIGLTDQLLSQNVADYLECEINSRIYARRSIVAKRSLKAGSRITFDDLDFKRPGKGIPPSMVETVLGKTLSRDMNEDDQFSVDCFK